MFAIESLLIDLALKAHFLLCYVTEYDVMVNTMVCPYIPEDNLQMLACASISHTVEQPCYNYFISSTSVCILHNKK